MHVRAVPAAEIMAAETMAAETTPVAVTVAVRMSRICAVPT